MLEQKSRWPRDDPGSPFTAHSEDAAQSKMKQSDPTRAAADYSQSLQKHHTCHCIQRGKFTPLTTFSLSTMSAVIGSDGDGFDYDEAQAEDLKHHLNSVDKSGYMLAIFIERAPPSTNGAKCNRIRCKERIEPGTYRMAVNPGIAGFQRSNKASAGKQFVDPSSCPRTLTYADLYHVECLEEVVNFSDKDINDRIEAVTRFSFPARGLKGLQILDGKYLVDGGIERLILPWKVWRGYTIDSRLGLEKRKSGDGKDFENLYFRAGAPDYVATPRIAGMSWDTKPWNLFEEYLQTAEEDVDD